MKCPNLLFKCAVVVAQLVERSEVRIQSAEKFMFTVNCMEKTKIKKKEAVSCPFLE